MSDGSIEAMAGETPGEKPPFEMRISMSVLDALGINLYSNAAAVLSEMVANAWDANANLVRIDWVAKSDVPFVRITDDGTGMSREELNKRFLTVGYPKRPTEGGESDGYHRPFMGRKGIGKLSVFSLADTIEVHSSNGSESSAFRIEMDALKKAIDGEKAYAPTPITPSDALGSHGTIIELTDLRRSRMDLTISALRKRLARRFDVLTLTVPDAADGDDSPVLKRIEDEIDRTKAASEAADVFYVTINDEPVTFDDRVELPKMEYIWEFAGSSLPSRALSPDVTRFTIPNAPSGESTWSVSGWFGTVGRPGELVEDADAGSLKNIMVLSRGRPIQEGIVDKLDFNRMFVSYLTGQVRADFLDSTENEDIATSDRQRLMEDDPRVTALQTFLRATLLKASEEWSLHRPKKKAKEVLANNKPIREWIDSLKPYQRDAATQLMGTIESLQIPESSDLGRDRRRLFQSGIIAFERIGLREDLEQLEALSTSIQSEDILNVLSTLESYESAAYLDIIRARVETIQGFQSDVADNVLEKVLQERLHSHLWLLDPSWDRISEDVTMEERVFELAESFGAKRPDEDALKRIDLRYSNVQNRHVVIELKRPDVVVDIDVLYAQGLTYISALRKVLEETNRLSEPYEVIFVVGQKPTTKMCPPIMPPDDYARNRIGELPGRLFRYPELILSAQNQYAEYINRNKDLSRISAVLAALSDDDDTVQDADGGGDAQGAVDGAKAIGTGADGA